MTEIEGLFLEDISVGQKASFAKTISEADILLYAGVSGDTNPLHLNQEYAETTIFKSRIAHGMLSSGLISAVIGTKLPGPGSIYISQSLAFKAPVRIGDTVTATVEIIEVIEDKSRIRMDCKCLVRDKVVISGEAVIMVPHRP